MAAFIIAFCVPYLLDDIGANIGWVFGAISFLAAIYAYFCVPEIKVSALGEGPLLYLLNINDGVRRIGL